MIIILKISTWTHLPLVPHVCVRLSALFQVMACCPFSTKPLAQYLNHADLSLKINWTLRNNPVKFISPCYLIHLFIMVHKIWIELNWNWKKMNWIGIELKDSESDLNWNWIELKNPESNLNWNWIELKEMNWSEPCAKPCWLLNSQLFLAFTWEQFHIESPNCYSM